MTFKVFDRDGNGFICRTDDELDRATSRDDELGREAHRQRECVQNMLMHCQPQTKANCVKIETKLNSISAKTTSRQETSQIGGERTKRTRSRMSFRADEVHKPVGKPSAERSTSRRRGCRQRQKDGTENRIQQKPRGRKAGRQGGFHGRPQQSDRRIQSVGTPACKRRKKHSAAQLKLM